jgi:hypothetical protein
MVDIEHLLPLDYINGKAFAGICAVLSHTAMDEPHMDEPSNFLTPNSEPNRQDVWLLQSFLSKSKP